ncbi:claudin-15-like [Styela clava]
MTQFTDFGPGSSLIILAFLTGLSSLICFIYVTLTPCWYVLYAEASISPYENCYGLWTFCSSTGLCGKWLSGSLLGPHGAQRNVCRGLMIGSCLLSGASLFLHCLAMKCVLLMNLDVEKKAKFARISATLWLLSGTCCLAAVTWYAIDVLNAVWKNEMQSEFSVGIFTGWGASVMAYITTALLFAGSSMEKRDVAIVEFNNSADRQNTNSGNSGRNEFSGTRNSTRPADSDEFVTEVSFIDRNFHTMPDRRVTYM